LIPETTQENLATAPDSANIDRFQARHRQQLCLGRQPAAATHIVRCFPNRRDGIARTRAIVSNPVFGPISTVAVGGVGVLIDVTDPVMFLCLGAGLTGWSDLTVEAD